MKVLCFLTHLFILTSTPSLFHLDCFCGAKHVNLTQFLLPTCMCCFMVVTISLSSVLLGWNVRGSHYITAFFQLTVYVYFHCLNQLSSPEKLPSLILTYLLTSIPSDYKSPEENSLDDWQQRSSTDGSSFEVRENLIIVQKLQWQESLIRMIHCLYCT